MYPFVWRAWRAPLRLAHMPAACSRAEACRRLGPPLAGAWDANRRRARPARLAALFLRTYASWIISASALTFLAEVVCKSLSAYSVGQMLLHMANRGPLVDPAWTSLHFWRSDPLALWCGALIGATCCWALLAHFYGFQMMRLSLHARVACSYLIYRKLLRLGAPSAGPASQAKVINLLSNDLDKFNYVFVMLPFLWVGPLQAIVSVYLLWPILGPSCLGSLMVLACLLPVQSYLSKKYASFRTRIAAHTDRRVRLLNETISSLRLIKLYAWETPFQAALDESRRKETDLLHRLGIIKGINVAFMYIASKLVLFVTLIFHCFIFGGTLDARTLFMSMAMLNNVQFPVTQLIPRAVSFGVESLVSFGRIEEFLMSDEFLPSDRLKLQSADSKPKNLGSCWRRRRSSARSGDAPLSSSTAIATTTIAATAASTQAGALDYKQTILADHNNINKLSLPTQQMPGRTDQAPMAETILKQPVPFVDFNQVGASWLDSSIKTIAGVTFKCESPGLLIVCGQVASGKSSLLLSMLNELPISEGNAHICGSLGYASQTAWIFNGSVRENIIFGQPYDESRYQRILDACALRDDLELLGQGADLTYIQDGSLSGGQKARINLARCLYRESDIYLLDDPFSAIDARIREHIFKKAICGLLKDKLVILATHQVSLLTRSDRVLLLGQSGQQLAYCHFNELRDRLKLLSSSAVTNGSSCEPQQLKWLDSIVASISESGDQTDAEKDRGNDNNDIIKENDEGPILLSSDGQSGQSPISEEGVAGMVSSINTGASRNGANIGVKIWRAANEVALDCSERVQCGRSFVEADAPYSVSEPDSNAICFPPPTWPANVAKVNQENREKDDPIRNSKSWTCQQAVVGELSVDPCGSDEGRNSSQERCTLDQANSTLLQAKLLAPADSVAEKYNTSGSIHAPYGSLSFADRSNKDKTLITIANSSNVQEGKKQQQRLQLSTGDQQQNEGATNISGQQQPVEQANRKASSPCETGAAHSTDKKQGPDEDCISKLMPWQKLQLKQSHQQHQENHSVNKVNRTLSHEGAEAKQATIMEISAHYRTASGQKAAQKCNGNLIQDKEKSQTSSSGCDLEKLKTTEKVDMREKSLASQATICGGPKGEDQQEASACSRLPGIRVWYEYYTQTSRLRLLMICLTFLITQAVFSTVDIYLTVWSLADQNRVLLSNIASANQQQFAFLNNQKAYAHQRLIDAGSLSNNLNTTSQMHGFHHTLSDSGHIIQYDRSLPRSLMSPLITEYYNGFDNKRTMLEIALLIQNVGISPLSSRSSRLLPSSLALNQLSFNPIPLGSDYLADSYPKNAVTGITRDNNINNNNEVIFLNGYPGEFSTGHTNSNVGQMKLEHYITESPPNTQSTPAITTTAHHSSHNSTPMPVDGNIFEESQAALAVKSIYRPLYLLVNNFTSGDHAITYTLLLMALFSCSAVANVLSLTSSNKSAISLYKKLTDGALFAKTAFFDQNPAARFLNRATRDIGIIDDTIPNNANQAYDLLLQTLATFILIGAVDFHLALPSLIILFIILIFHTIHVKSTKDIHRLEGISRSPIISHITTSLAGLYTIRATNSEKRFEHLFIENQDVHSSIFLLYLGCSRTLAVFLDVLNATYIGMIAVWAVVSGLSGPSAGLIITSAMVLSGLSQHGFMKLTETKSLMTSVERVIEYCKLPQEEYRNSSSKRSFIDGRHELKHSSERGQKFNPSKINHSVGNDSDVKRNWLTGGSVEYSHVDLYYDKLKKPVLKNISFKLDAGEKVAIVGRTGAGKSSIITTLFRLYEFEGTILVDGIDIKTIDLVDLRSAIGIIPQTPILFSTSIRKNLDPFDSHNDFEIWHALEKAHLRQTVSALPGNLDYTITDGGSSFSSGQKQLICLARVMLRRTSLIVMDEATANVDSTTDSIIQATIRREFKHCTVITIAHRLETILDYDRILVLNAGRIVDFDTPDRLLADPNGYISQQLRQSSDQYIPS